MKQTERVSVNIGTGYSLSLADVIAVARAESRAVLPGPTRVMLQNRRDQIVRHVEVSEEPAYGFNRGFGHNVDVAVPRDRLSQLQQNLIRSHSVGVGEYAPIEVVRATILLRAHSLAQGFSGVRSELIDGLIQLLELDIIPCVPCLGSVGASGDLAPLAHIALGLIGEGWCHHKGERIPTEKAFSLHNIRPLALEMKEGLALINGVQFSNAIGLLCVQQMQGLLKNAVIATALTSQVMLASDSGYAERMMSLRPHRGAMIVAKWLCRLIEGSPLREAHRDFQIDGEIQDPYNLRCAPQVLGSCYDLIQEALDAFVLEANSVTDNPLLLESASSPGQFTDIISGGHFHGMPVAVKLYNLIQAASIMARLSNMRCVRYVDQARNKGLGSDLVWPSLSEADRSISSGMMIPEYVSAALTNEIWGKAMPSHLFSLSTDAGQEDHVSMSATLGMRVLDILPRLAEILAIELAFAHQAAAIRKISDTIASKGRETTLSKVEAKRFLKQQAGKNAVECPPGFEPRVELSYMFKLPKDQRQLSPVSEKLLSQISKIIPVLKADRSLSEEIQALAKVVKDGSLHSDLPKSIWE